MSDRRQIADVCLILEGTYPYVKGFLGNVAGVEVVDPSTVQIRLKAPLTPFLQYLAHHSLYVYSPEALKPVADTQVSGAETHPSF